MKDSFVKPQSPSDFFSYINPDFEHWGIWKADSRVEIIVQDI